MDRGGTRKIEKVRRQGIKDNNIPDKWGAMTCKGYTDPRYVTTAKDLHGRLSIN